MKLLIETGDKVECINAKSPHYQEKGVFTGWLANGLIVKFDNGKEGLFLPNDLKKNGGNKA